MTWVLGILLFGFLVHDSVERMIMSAAFEALKVQILAAETAMVDASGLITHLAAQVAAGPAGEVVDPVDVSNVQDQLIAARNTLTAAMAAASV